MWKTDSRTRHARARHRQMDPVVAMKVARGLLGLLFALVAWGALVSTYQAWRSHGYQPVTGVVTEKTVTRTERHAPDSGNRHRPGYYLHVAYAYEVGGRRFEGDRIQAGTFGMVSGDMLRRFGSRVEQGQDVTVYIDPRNPQRAVLERGLSGVAIFLYVLGGFFGCAWFVLNILVKGFAQPHPPVAPAGPGAPPGGRGTPQSPARPLMSVAARRASPVTAVGPGAAWGRRTQAGVFES